MSALNFVLLLLLLLLRDNLGFLPPAPLTSYPDVSTAATGGQVLLDEPTFAAVKESMQHLSMIINHEGFVRPGLRDTVCLSHFCCLHIF
jgi:hypothetical protein